MKKKEFVEFSKAKPFLDWLAKQPPKITKHLEFELTWPHHTNKDPAIVTFYVNDDGLDTYDLFRAFTRDTPKHTPSKD